jgi:DNA-binding transcriptional ArsR family regulator
MAVLKALSEINRLRIMRLLLREESDVGAIASRLRISEYNASKHLKILRVAGLLEVRKDGRKRLYGASDEIRKNLAAGGDALELQCCTFRFDRLPK